ncbi:MAG: hypothetical protein KIT79_03125 [Deltaproteobacteria bacterium]|nr:hypothetical protein [Deltaproteobacteria bacterium]
MDDSLAKHQKTEGVIELRLHDVNQLFNSMDPSPFTDKDLDDKAEAFIVEWAEDFPSDMPLRLLVHIERPVTDLSAPGQTAEAIHRYFSYRVERNRRKLRQFLKQGRLSLLVGLSFLVGCLLASDLIQHTWHGTAATIFAESLTIGGWVAMWRPLEIFLYDWWPIRRTGKVYQKLSEMDVQIQIHTDLEIPSPAVVAQVTAARSG